MITFLLVGVAFAIIELTIVMNWPWLQRTLSRNPILELVFSLALGVVGGIAMGIPAGVTIAIGNVFATMITKTIYSFHLIERGRQFKIWCANTTVGLREFAHSLAELGKTLTFLIALPVRILLAILYGLNRVAASANKHLPQANPRAHTLPTGRGGNALPPPRQPIHPPAQARENCK